MDSFKFAVLTENVMSYKKCIKRKCIKNSISVKAPKVTADKFRLTRADKNLWKVKDICEESLLELYLRYTLPDKG